MEYNRLVAYIYSYSQGIKGANTGFAKIEIRNDILKIRITMQKGHVKGNVTGSVKMFYRKGERAFGITLGDMSANNFGGNFEYVGSGVDIENSGQCFNDICGLRIELFGEEKYIFGSEWDDLGFPKLWDVGEEVEPEPANTEVQLEVAEVVETEEFVEPTEVIEITKNTEEEAIQETRTTSIWEELRGTREQVEPFADDNFYDIVEITPSDIERMPNTNWGLLTNSFVNYGYNTFRHLILGSYMQNGTERHFIGVPGVYNRRERLTAGMYGFERFKFSMRSDMRLSQFGYWIKELSD